VKSKIRKLYLRFRAIPKTIFFNFKYLSFYQAIKFPILVSHRTWLMSTKGHVSIDSADIKPAMIQIGFGEVGIFDQNNSRSIWQVNGNVIFGGRCSIGHGSKISVGNNATLKLGENFTITAESSIVCHENIIFGDNCLLSWDILIMDTDFHKIKNFDNKVINAKKAIKIGNNVWIGCRSLVLKGCEIGNNCVIAANTTIVKSFNLENKILGGNPAKVLKDEVTWEI
jgi:acetyltransferase-like isoleucine patch superfamily enzyme